MVGYVVVWLVGLVIGAGSMYLVRNSKIATYQQRIKSLQSKVIFDEILQAVCLYCTFKVKTIDVNTNEEGFTSWSPYLSFVGVEAQNQVYNISLLDQTIGGDPNLACKLLVNLTSTPVVITIHASGYKDLFSFMPGEPVPEELLKKVKNFVKPPQALMLDEKAEEQL